MCVCVRGLGEGGEYSTPGDVHRSIHIASRSNHPIILRRGLSFKKPARPEHPVLYRRIPTALPPLDRYLLPYAANGPRSE